MSDAPERIWAQDAEPSECDYTGGGWWDDECGHTQYPHMVEYVRADTLTALQAENERLREALKRITTPLAFYMATSDVDPEVFARMVYAYKVRGGMSLKQAEKETEAETQERYPLGATLSQTGEDK